MRRIRLALTLAAMLPMAAFAQMRYLGISTSNWSGTNGMYLNPANLADSRHKFVVDLFSMNVGADNNLATFKAGDIFKGVTNGDKLSDNFAFSSKDQFSMLVPMVELRLPGIMVNIKGKHGVALTMRVRGMNQFHNFNQNLYKNIVDSSFTPSSTATFQAGDFNWTAHLWSELNLGYGGVIYNKNPMHMVKGGLTVRYLMGAGFIGAYSSNINAKYNGLGMDPSLTISNTDFHYATGGINLNGGNNNNNLFGSTGKGFGADLGVVYEFRPKYKKYQYDMDGKTGLINPGKNPYMLRFSASIVDLGAIKYKNSSAINVNQSGSAVIKGSEIADYANTYDSLRYYLNSKGIKADSSSNTVTKVGMPSTLIVGVDYHAIGGLYVNATYFGNVAKHDKFGNSYYSSFTLTPRFDIKAFSFGVPITYSTLSKAIKAGVGIRLGGFIVGSDDMLTFFNSGNGMNLYFGAYVPINRKMPKDSDGDHVSNKKDKCKHEPGVWEMKGCPNPDKDGDGVLDKDDKCPDVAGSKTANGCPDADLDGVADAEDRCPQQAGSPAMQGCPDRDKDGIADVDDACPDVPGLAQYKGCPDTDGDGIADNEDACPNAAGPIANQGCPDTDNDGIADNLDKCPTVPGTANNHGCPEISVQVKKRLAFAATAIQFDLGKATIKKTSNKLLDEVVKILNDYPDYVMSIEGHTDNVGKADKNLQLSKERAEAVKNYFISKGIAADRLMADGFGDTKPVASNKTAAGRAKNRRVAMDLKLRD